MWQPTHSNGLEKLECILDFVVSHSSATVAATTSKMAIKVFDANKTQLKHTLKGHTGTVSGVCWEVDSDNVLFSSSNDKTVKMWDLREKNPNVKTFKFEKGGRELSCVATNGDKVFAGSQKSVNSWNIADGTQQASFDTFGEITQYGDKNKLYVASTDGVITIYDVSQEDEDDAFIDEQSITQMGFYGDLNNHVWCLTPTQELSLWDLENEEQPCIKKWGKSTREELSTTSGLTVFNLIGCSYCHNQGLLYLFAGSATGDVALFDLSPDINFRSTLTGGHTEIVKAACIIGKEKEKVVWTAGDDDSLTFWNSSTPTEGGVKRHQKKKDSRPYTRQ